MLGTFNKVVIIIIIILFAIKHSPQFCHRASVY